MTKKMVLFAVLLVAAVTFAQTPERAGAVRYDSNGERIIALFDVHAAELRSVLRKISAHSGRDIINSNDASRVNVTLSVTNKSWREVLTIICMVHDLVFVEEPAFIYVMTAVEAAARGIGGADSDANVTAPSGLVPAAPNAMAELLGPLMREVIPLRYTTAAEMAANITPFLTQRGRITPVQHTNALILVDTDENLRQMKMLIGQIDIQTPQISISCKIVEVSARVVREIGVNWGFTEAVDGRPVTGGQFWPGLASRENPFFNPDGHSATFGVLDNAAFQITLDFLFQDSKTEIVAQPQITTLNNKEANIFMGQEIPINTRDDAGNTITQMINVGTQLTVTPYVSGDGKIMLALNPSKESYTQTPAGPIINRQSAKTNVLVNNGETVVIAGLTSNEQSRSEAGIPILKDIPIIGNLFKRSVRETDKKDLVIFITPHIIHPGI